MAAAVGAGFLTGSAAADKVEEVVSATSGTAGVIAAGWTDVDATLSTVQASGFVTGFVSGVAGAFLFGSALSAASATGAAGFRWPPRSFEKSSVGTLVRI